MLVFSTALLQNEESKLAASQIFFSVGVDVSATDPLFVCDINIHEPGHEKTCLMSYANNKGADQPAHPRSLISTFVVRCLDSIITLVSISEISSLYLVSVAAQAGLCLTWLKIPKTGFLVTGLICIKRAQDLQHQ